VPSALSPLGTDDAGLVMTCSFGVEMLRTGRLPSVDGKLVICVSQGETDFLTHATAWGAKGCGIVFVGLCYGQPWLQSIADRIPNDTEIIMCVKPRLYGAIVAKACTESVAGRLLVRWSNHDDLRDCLIKAGARVGADRLAPSP
jgi:hypothetical protein